MKKIVYALFLFFVLMLNVEAKEVKVYLFYSETCPHCAAEKEFLEEYKKENPNFVYETYEVTQNEENDHLLDLVKETFKCENSYVPYTVIGEVGLSGFTDLRKNEIIHFIEKYQNEEHRDVVKEVIDTGKAIDLEKTKEEEKKEKEEKYSNVNLPFLGEVDAKKVSLPLISIIIGFVDGFNPCAMWVLIFLITMLFNMKDRKKMWILGITFLVASSLVYLLFMIGLLKIANTVGMNFRYLIALVALIGGIVNLNNFRKSLKSDVGCEVTDEKSKKKTIERIKEITLESNFFLSIIGIILLAVSVNLVELACSAGLPTMFIEILSLNNLSIFEYSLYMLLYILMFMIDDIVIFVIAMTSLKVTGISNKYTKYSHLVGGLIMIIIGLLMIFAPNILMFNF